MSTSDMTGNIDVTAITHFPPIAALIDASFAWAAWQNKRRAVLNEFESALLEAIELLPERIEDAVLEAREQAARKGAA